MQSRKLLFIIFLFGILLPTAHALAANITDSYKYAWSNNVGYINFENLTVGNSTLSGYAWSTNKGWIKFDPSNGGVLNNGQGVLSGYAWGEQLGWINFSGVSVNTSTGKFSGTATSDLIGTLTFDCPTYCDVRTDWRPVAPPLTPTPVSGGVSGGSTYILPTPTPTQPITVPTSAPAPTTVSAPKTIPSILKTNTSAIPVISKSEPTSETSASIRDRITEFYKTIDKPEPTIRKKTILRTDANHVENYNMPLVIGPNQTGILVWDFSTTEMANAKQKQAVSIELPRAINAFKITFFIDKTAVERLPSLNQANVLSAVFDITAKDNKGNRVREFSNPLKITLIVPKDLRNRNDLGVYYLADSVNAWTHIPEAAFDNIGATFYVNHLTRFAIFALTPDALTKDGVPPKTLAVASDTSSHSFMWLYIIIGTLFTIWLSCRKK